MMRQKLRSPYWLILLMALVALTGLVLAQEQKAEKTEAAPVLATYTAPEIKQPLPFGIGETIKYEIKFSRFPIYATVGEMTFVVSENKPTAEPTETKLENKISRTEAAPEVDKPATPAESERLLIRGEAVSKGILTSLFGIKVKDIFESVVDKKDLGIYTSAKYIEEGKRRREQIATFEREKQQVTFVDKDLNATTAPPRVVKAKTTSWVVDPVAAVYFVRTQQLTEGQTIKIPISDNGKTNEVEILVGEHEEISVDAGKFNTIKLDAKVFGGAMFDGNGFMYIWVTDDAARVPVKFQIKHRYGTITGNLLEKTPAPLSEPKPAADQIKVKTATLN